MNAQGHLGEKLSAYLDDELQATERAAVDQHLRECAACGRLLEDMAAVDSAARALAVEAPEGYFDAFPGRLRARLAARRPRRLPAWTLAAAAALLLAVVTPLTMVGRPAAPAAAPAARDMAQPEPPLARANVEAGADLAAPPTTTVATQEPLKSLGYRGDLPSQRETKGEEFRQKQAVAVDGRLRERDAESGVGGLARSEPSRRSLELKDDALKMKKEAGADLSATADDNAPMRSPTADEPPTGAAAGDKAAANAAGPPASKVVPAPAPAAAAEEEAPPKAAKRADAPAPGKAGGRAAPPAATPPPQPAPPTTVLAQPAAPAAPPPAETRRAQGLASKPSPAEGALGATKAAEAQARTADADAYGEQFAAIASRPLATGDEARQASREWSELARRAPQAPGADEARVRAIEALATAWRLERKDEDRAQARRLAQAYLATSAPQKDRVRLAVRSLER